MKTKLTSQASVSNLLRSAVIYSSALLLGFGACKKDNTSESPAPVTPAQSTPTKTELLTAKPWKLTACTVSPAMMGSTDMYAMMQACEKDNTLKLNADANKSYAEDEGASKCSSSDPQSKGGAWKMNENETEVTLTPTSGDASQLRLIDLNATTCKVSETMMYSGTTYTITCTYTH